MRTVTIRRRRSAVGTLGTFKVYVEDANAPETTIQGVPCRKVGVLKNGKEASFELGGQATRLFVINGESSKEICVELYALPQGEEDVTLEGECQFNPAAGNAFRFDGNTEEQAQSVRRKSSKAGLIALIATVIGASIVGGFAGRLAVFARRERCAAQQIAEQAQTYTVRDLQITLTDAFEKVADDTEASFESSTCGVYIMRDAFSEYPELADWTLAQYVEVISDGQTCSEQDGITYFEYDYTDPESNAVFHYLVAVYKAPDAFWIVNFATFAENAIRLRPQFFDWAKSVTFADHAALAQHIYQNNF